MQKIFSMLLAAVGLVACTSQPQNKSSVLVLYYSQTGATEQVATQLQAQLGADIEALEVVNPYNGDFGATIARCQQEMSSGELPELKPLKANVSDYDLIFVGYPVWFGTYARPIAALTQLPVFDGKKVVTFCTYGSGGLQSSTADLQAALPMAEVVAGYGVRNARIGHVEEELNRFLIENGYKEGEIEALPAFMEHHPVDEAEAEIFQQACGSYQYPLGEPVDVAVREREDVTEYEFTSLSTDRDGNENFATIYVVLEKVEGAVPEFTQVVR